MKPLMIIAAMFFFSFLGYSAVYYVPDDYSTIQGAIDASNSRDTIIVRSGTYYENIDYLGKSLTIESESGPTLTVIDGAQNGSVVTMTNITGSPVLEGFTVTNGLAEKGGGIYSKNSDPYISDSIVTNNGTENGDWSPGGDGGGIFCDSGTIVDSVISNNETGYGSQDFRPGGYGGGIFIASSFTHIENCLIENNTTGRGGSGTHAGDGGWGGGIYSSPGASPCIVNCTVSDNTTGEGGRNHSAGSGSPGYGGHGGGIFCINAEIIGCTIMGNRTGKGGEDFSPWGWGYGGDGGYGGGIHCESTQIVNCMIYFNETGDGGKATFSIGDGGYGGGVFFTNNPPQELVNCTLVNNQTGFSGNGSVQSSSGGIHANPHVVVKNSILWGNLPDQIDNTTLTVSHSDIQNGTGEPWFDPDTCIDQEPEFANPGSDEYHLSWISPGINRGTSAGAPSDDFDGDPRPFMGTADMGADEFIGLHPLELAVFTLSASGGGDIDFAIDAGAANANRSYVLLGTLTGTVPGFGLPGGMTLPLNWDGFTDLVVMFLNNFYFVDFLGQLDGSGQMTATLHVPGLFPIWVGEIMQYAYTLYSPFDYVSNPVEIEVVP
ncbi:MAG: choice-of-anchor Q domain-containing protein [Planctomycetota bacterium]|jgi:hypothetical protein